MNKDKIMNYGIISLSILLGLLMLNSGVNKFFTYMPPAPLEPGALIDAFKASGYMWQSIAIVEIIAGIFLLTKRFRALGAVLLLPISTNIVLLDIFLSPNMLSLGISVFLVNIVILFSQKAKLLPLLKSD